MLKVLKPLTSNYQSQYYNLLQTLGVLRIHQLQIWRAPLAPAVAIALFYHLSAIPLFGCSSNTPVSSALRCEV